MLCRPPLGINPGKGIGKRRREFAGSSLLRYTEPYRFIGRRPMRGAVEGFHTLSRNYHCVVLTARRGRSEAFTARWLDRYFGPGIVLEVRMDNRETGPGFKVRRTRELGALAHFEDDPHTAEWVAESLSAVFLVDWPRNRWLNGVSNVYRVKELTDALPVLATFAPNGE